MLRERSYSNLPRGHLVGKDLAVGINFDQIASFKIHEIAKHLTGHVVVSVEYRIARLAQGLGRFQPSGRKMIRDIPYTDALDLAPTHRLNGCIEMDRRNDDARWNLRTVL